MSHSDPNDRNGPTGPNDPYRKNPYAEGPGQPPGQYGPPPDRPGGEYGQPPAGPLQAPPGTMPGKVSSARLVFLVAGGIQALFSVLLMIAFASAKNRLEDTYGDLDGTGTGAYYTLFAFFLLHALAGIALAVRFPRRGGGLRIAAIVWSALLILLGIVALPLGLLWIVLGIVCVVLLASAESAAWFDRRHA
ncbi:hypothetical protein [Streptomyces sp. URMC 125]|uniref:hypothetical protein n=1 Tax=Streptomyces sp. URMC 125 TaxID=3423419 RepID=UPI003F1A8A2D